MNCSRRRVNLDENFKESLEFRERIDYNKSVKESTHSKSGCSQKVMLCPYGHRSPCGSDRVGILFTLISLIEKGDNRYNQAAKGYE